jgi:hypothetical protein
MASPYCERVDDYFCASTARTALIAGEFFWPFPRMTGLVLGNRWSPLEAKNTELHVLRHFFASWCINRKEVRGSLKSSLPRFEL